MKLALLFLIFTHASFATVSLKDFNWEVSDVADARLSKEKIFSEMDRKFIKVGSSICANRALMWVNDFKTKYDLDAAKIFLFYTDKTGGAGDKKWWYHVAPILADKNELFVMDAGFTFITTPLKLHDWINTFATGANCKEIEGEDTDLIKLMNSGHQFPRQTRHGSYDCYYKIVPAGFWFPTSVAASMSGENIPNEIQKSEVYSACIEAVTSPLGRVFGGGKKSCKKYLGQ